MTLVYSFLPTLSQLVLTLPFLTVSTAPCSEAITETTANSKGDKKEGGGKKNIMEKQHEVSNEVNKGQGDILTISGMSGTSSVLLVQSTAKSCGVKLAALEEAQAFKLQVWLCGGHEDC